MNIGDLRKAIEGLDDSMEIMLEVFAEVEMDDEGTKEEVFFQASLENAMVEARCDEIDCLYLTGMTYDEEVEEDEEPEEEPS